MRAALMHQNIFKIHFKSLILLLWCLQIRVYLSKISMYCNFCMNRGRVFHFLKRYWNWTTTLLTPSKIVNEMLFNCVLSFESAIDFMRIYSATNERCLCSWRHPSCKKWLPQRTLRSRRSFHMNSFAFCTQIYISKACVLFRKIHTLQSTDSECESDNDYILTHGDLNLM